MKNLIVLFSLVLLSTINAFGQQCYAVYADNNVVLVAMDQKLYRSTDNAVTFALVLPAGEDNLAIRCITKVNNTLIIGGLNGDNRIFRSTDNGQTWSIANSGMPNTFGFSSAIPSNALTVGSRVFMGGTNFFRVSDNDGLSWQTMPIDPATGGIAFTGGNLWHSTSIGGPGLNFSTDLGLTWQTPPTNPNTSGNAAVGFAQFADTLVVLTAENGSSGIKRTSDNGATWQAIPNTLQLGLSMIEVNGVLYACDFNGFQKSINHGLTWTIECNIFQWHTYGGKLHVSGNDIWMASANGPVRYNITQGTCEVIDISSALSLNEELSESSIAIFPNPTNTSVTLSNVSVGSTFQITDLTGKLVYKNSFKEKQFVIDTKDFPNGMYTIQIENEGVIVSKKLVVNK